MPTTSQSESERAAPWGGAYDEPVKPIRPYWDGYHRFCTNHGEHKIHLAQGGRIYVGYTPIGKSEMYADAINADGAVCPPRDPFCFATEKAATAAIKKHHRQTLRDIRLAKKVIL